jgi:hypothetical protein
VHKDKFTFSLPQCKTTEEATLESWEFKKLFQRNLSTAKPPGVALLMQVAALRNIMTKRYSNSLMKNDKQNTPAAHKLYNCHCTNIPSRKTY